MRRFVTAVALLSAAALVSSALSADEPMKPAKNAKVTESELHKRMKATHRGEKTPHARVVAELKKDSPDWDQLAKDAKAFEEMGKSFKGVKLYYASPAGYIKGAATLTKAVAQKDRKAADAAFVALTNSCITCHNYGGPAGFLTFDRDRLLK